MKALNSIDSSPNNQRNQSNNGNASCCRSVFDHYRVNYTDYEIAKDELNCFYQFKNRGLCQKYLLYHLNTKPFSGVVFLMTLNALVFLPGTTMAAIVYAFSDTPVYSFLLVKALIVICVANSAVFGSLYILERLFPTWKVYKRFLRMFKCLRVRATRIYTTNLTNDQKTRKFDDQSPDGNVDKPLHGLLATENEEDNNDDEMDDYLTNDEKRNRIHFSRNNAYQDQRKNNSHSGYGSMSKRFVFIQQFFVLNLMIINILYFIHTVIQEDCNHYSNSTFSAMFRNCRSEQIKSNRIDIYPLLFMFTPVLLSCIFRETLFEIQIANHFIVVLLGLLSTIVTNFNGLSIGMFCGWMIGGYCVLLDLHLHHVAAFLTSYKLREILLEKERNADQAAATEMRHMIGNVAHDLKTPLASFTTGLEIIADIIETNEKAIELLFSERTLNAVDSKDTSWIKSYPTHHPSNSSSPVLPFTQLSTKSLSFRSSTKASVHGLLENNQGIKHCLQNIRDTNTFMLMTINRCIDYTKASRGFKLVPKYETLDLQETLRLPLDCMKNIQERIRIALKPIDMKEICSHIITDKQWLQENILCLLSNAVKYSTGGEVTIAVYLAEMEKIQVKEPPNQPNERDLSHDANDLTPFSFLRERWTRQLSESVFGKRRFSTVIPSKPSSVSASLDPINGDNSDNESYLISNSPSMPPSLISTREDSIPALETALTRQKSRLYSIEEGNEKTVTKRFDSTEVGIQQLDEKRKGIYPLVSGNTSTTSTNSLSHYIRFDVEDTGIGMSSEAMGQLFSPFRQAQRLAGGTGLGLYSLAKRVEAQNGSYGVMKRSDGKQGSLFWFAIPYRADYTTADLFSDPLRNTSSSSYSNKREVRTKVMPDGSPLILKRKNSLEFGIIDMKLPKLHILLVDDSPSIVKMSSMMLKRQGHVIEIADNGENALQCIQNRWTSTQRGFDIILMDLQMPVMDGLEATRRLRSLEAECPSWLRPHSFEEDSESSSTANKLGQVYEAWSRTYPSHSYHHAMIGVSANSDDETAREAIEAGVDAFLPKPFSMDLFNSTAMKVLSKIYASYTFSH